MPPATISRAESDLDAGDPPGESPDQVTEVARASLDQKPQTESVPTSGARRPVRISRTFIRRVRTPAQ